jgi:hypothetical protein
MGDNGKENYIVEEQYQERYKLPCPVISKPCIQDQCPRWRVNMAAVPVQGLVAAPKMILVGKCQDDWNYDNTVMLCQMTSAMIGGMQQAMGGRPRGGPGLMSHGL